MPELRHTWRTMVELWPIAIGLIGCLVGGGVSFGILYKTINDNQSAIATHTLFHDTTDVDRKQWVQLRSLGARLVALETWREKIDDLTEPTEIQEWGYIKNQVRENKRLLEEHMRDRH